MALKLQTAPATEPLTLAEAKAHLRVDHVTDDALINGLIRAAREHAEGYTHRALITQTWEWWLDCFPGYFELPWPRLQSVSAITYIDSVGATQTLASSQYVVDSDSEPGRIVRAPGVTWPSTDYERPNPVKVRFNAGYGLAADVPQPIKQAMLLHAEAHYDRDDRNMEPLMKAAEALLWPYRVWLV